VLYRGGQKVEGYLLTYVTGGSIRLPTADGNAARKYLRKKKTPSNYFFPHCGRRAADRKGRGLRGEEPTYSLRERKKG